MKNSIKHKTNDKYKSHLIDKQIFWSLPFSFFVCFLIVILSINQSTSIGSSGAAVVQSTAFFALYKVILSSGISLLFITFGLNYTNGFTIDIYEKNNSSYLFTNHTFIIIIKIIIIIIGLILCVLSSMFKPESKTLLSFWDYFFICIGILFIMSLIKNLIQNRGDYVLIENEKLAWFDDKNNAVNEIKFSEIKSYKKILEDTSESPEITGFLIVSNLEKELKIDFESMSLIPQSEFILKVISEKIPQASIDQ
jgi:hypothetical protein